MIYSENKISLNEKDALEYFEWQIYIKNTYYPFTKENMFNAAYNYCICTILSKLSDEDIKKQIENDIKEKPTNEMKFIIIYAIAMREGIVSKRTPVEKTSFIYECNEIIKVESIVVNNIIKFFDIEFKYYKPI